MKRFLTILAICLLTVGTALADDDIVSQVYLNGTLSKGIPVEFSLVTDGNGTAAGYVKYTRVKGGYPIMVVGRWDEYPSEGDEPNYHNLIVSEYMPDGLLTGNWLIHLRETPVKGRYRFVDGTWTSADGEVKRELKDVTVFAHLPDYFDKTLLTPATREEMGNSYEYGVYGETVEGFKSWRGGTANIMFYDNGKIGAEVDNAEPLRTGFAYVYCGQDKAATLMGNVAEFRDVNDCHYSFRITFFKKFIEVFTTHGVRRSDHCFTGGNILDGIYIKQ